MHYPYKAKHSVAMRPTLAEINALDFKIECDDNDVTTTQRISGRAIVSYELEGGWETDDQLVVKYTFSSEQHDTDDLACKYDGGYIDRTYLRKFRTWIDRSMWYAMFDHDGSLNSVSRRRLPGAMYIRVWVDDYDHTQIIVLNDRITPPKDRIKPHHYPPWVDKTEKTD
jgi:hypothetical protein